MASTRDTPNGNSSSTSSASANGYTNGHTDGHSDSTTTNPSTTPSPSLPIIIAGGGCVGLFLSLLLASSPLPNPLIVLEPSAPDPTSTRAMAHQPPTYPILSRVPGLLPELVAAGSLSAGLCFRTSAKHGSKLIAGKTFENSGEGMKGKGQLLLPQGKFQTVLLKRLAEFEEEGKVHVRLGSRVTSFTQRKGYVDVHLQTPSGDEECVQARYLVGADGAHSTVRRTLGVDLDGETLDAQLVATDIYYDFHAKGYYDANFILDPLDYGLIGRISAPDSPGEVPLWRVSYGVPLGISEEAINEEVHEKLARMLPGAERRASGEREYVVQRIAPYKAQQRCVSAFVHGDVLLVGDAAHLTNPYAGLGLASGMADASSLAEVLLRILSGDARDERVLLDAWSRDRREKFEEVVDRPSRMAYKRVKSDVSSEEKVQDLLSRDPMVAALKKGMPVMPPSLETKGEELKGW